MTATFHTRAPSGELRAIGPSGECLPTLEAVAVDLPDREAIMDELERRARLYSAKHDVFLRGTCAMAGSERILLRTTGPLAHLVRE